MPPCCLAPLPGPYCHTSVCPLGGSEPQEEPWLPGLFPNGTVNQAAMPLPVSAPALSPSSGLGGHFPPCLCLKERTSYSKAYKNKGESQETGRGMVGAGIESSRAKPSQGWSLLAPDAKLESFFFCFVFVYFFPSYKVI